jgi:RNA polymerase sigma-70 factor (ECF subfamily)
MFIGLERLHTYSDESLMKMVQNGNISAFEIIYKRYSRQLLQFFFRMLNQNEDVAQDFLQEVFLKLLDKKKYYDPQRKFSTWMYTMAANLCKNEYRRINNKNVAYQAVNELHQGAPQGKDEEHLDASLTGNLIWNEVEDLNESQKSAFILRYQHDLSLHEIAKITNCSEGTVKSRLFYATKKISDKLKEKNLHKED